MRWFELSLPPVPSVIGVARSTLTATARVADLDPDVAADAKTCISEAVTNALNAHTRDGVEDPILVRFGAGEGELLVEVHDRGTGPTPGVTEVRPITDIGAMAEGGFGIPVMHALADDFELRPAVGGGTVVKLRFASARVPS